MKKYFYILFLLGLSITGYAQVGIGVKSPASSTMLEVHSPTADKGVLLPKVSLVAPDSFAPIKGEGNDLYNVGLIIYNKTENTAKGLVEGYYYWTGKRWNSFSNGTDIDSIIETLVSKGAVFYGLIDGNKEDVLYTKKKDDAGNQIIEVINLLPTITENLKNTNQGGWSELKKTLGYDISEKAVYTGKSIKGQYMYSFFGTTLVQEDNAEVEGIELNEDVIKLLNKGEVFNVMVLDNKNRLIDINTTDIEITAGKLKFSFGSSSMYMTLPTGKYGVIVELLSSIEKL